MSFRWRRNLLAGLGLAAVLLLGIWGAKHLLGSQPAESEARSQLEPFSSNGKFGYQDQSGKAIIDPPSTAPAFGRPKTWISMWRIHGVTRAKQ